MYHAAVYPGCRRWGTPTVPSDPPTPRQARAWQRFNVTICPGVACAERPRLLRFRRRPLQPDQRPCRLSVLAVQFGSAGYRYSCQSPGACHIPELTCCDVLADADVRCCRFAPGCFFGGLPPSRVEAHWPSPCAHGLAATAIRESYQYPRRCWPPATFSTSCEHRRRG